MVGRRLVALAVRRVDTPARKVAAALSKRARLVPQEAGPGPARQGGDGTRVKARGARGRRGQPPALPRTRRSSPRTGRPESDRPPRESLIRALRSCAVREAIEAECNHAVRRSTVVFLATRSSREATSLLPDSAGRTKHPPGDPHRSTFVLPSPFRHPKRPFSDPNRATFVRSGPFRRTNHPFGDPNHATFLLPARFAVQSTRHWDLKF